jgi:hypothetical protein
VVSRAAPEFWQLYHDLPPELQAAARRAYHVFSQKTAHPGLRVERLRSDPRAWSVRVTRDVRAVALRHGESEMGSCLYGLLPERRILQATWT